MATTYHNEHLKSSVTVWHAVEVEHLKIPSLKRITFSYLKLGEKMEDDELPTQSIPFFTAFWFLKGNQTTNIFLWNRKITWFPNECMVKLWDFHPKMVHGLTWYYIDASFNLLFWTGFMDLIFSETPEEILLSPSLSVDPWLIVFVPGAVFLRTRFFCNIRRRWFFFWEKNMTVVYSFSPILMVQEGKWRSYLKRELLLENTSIFHWTRTLWKDPGNT